MKIRQGFVSNSSSSSFIMRAAKFTQKELIKALGIEDKVEKCDDEYDIYEEIGMSLPPDIDIESTGNYFGDLDFENLIVGKNIGRFEDGEVTEVDYQTKESDKKILEKLKSIGLEGDLKTFVQMISNDNY
jgi:hypothetical protein